MSHKTLQVDKHVNVQSHREDSTVGDEYHMGHLNTSEKHESVVHLVSEHIKHFYVQNRVLFRVWIEYDGAGQPGLKKALLLEGDSLLVVVGCEETLIAGEAGSIDVGYVKYHSVGRHSRWKEKGEGRDEATVGRKHYLEPVKIDIHNVVVEHSLDIWAIV